MPYQDAIDMQLSGINILKTFVVAAFLLLMQLSAPGWATPGDLDSAFGTSGIVITDVAGNTSPDDGHAVALQKDG